jgi:hypothetical protein
MNCNEIKDGLRVRTTKLGDTKGFLIKSRHLDCRKAGITGTVSGYVPGHGGDVWWVKHEDSEDIGAYCFTELEAVVMPNDALTKPHEILPQEKP